MKFSVTLPTTDLKKLVDDLNSFLSQTDMRIFEAKISDHMTEKCSYHLSLKVSEGYDHERGHLTDCGKSKISFEVCPAKPKPTEELASYHAGAINPDD